MTITSFVACWRGRLRDFRQAQGGNVAIIFGLAAIPVVGLMGAAADYSRATSAKAAMQAAVDATVLMLSKEVSGLTTAQLNDKAFKYVMANFNRPDAKNIVVTPTYSQATSELVESLQAIEPPDTESGEQAQEELQQLGDDLERHADEVGKLVDGASDSGTGLADLGRSIVSEIGAAVDETESALRRLQDVGEELRSGIADSDACTRLRERDVAVG